MSILGASRGLYGCFIVSSCFLSVPASSSLVSLPTTLELLSEGLVYGRAYGSGFPPSPHVLPPGLGASYASGTRFHHFWYSVLSLCDVLGGSSQYLGMIKVLGFRMCGGWR